MMHFNHTFLHAKKNKKKILERLSKVIDSGYFLEGKENNKLKKNLKHYLGKGYLTNVASGHDALFLALTSLNLTQDDEVIFPVNAYPTAFPIFLTKAKPVPVDSDENGQLDYEQLVNKITKNTKAIIIVHLYGLVGDLDKILKVVKDNSLVLIEDCAQSFGARYKSKPLGSFGDISCFSFYPTKNLGTLGDGGAIWTRHKKYYEYFVQAKMYGENERYNSVFISGHSRLPEIQAAILNIYFKHLSSDIKKKNKIYKYYSKEIHKANLNNKIRLLESNFRSTPVLHLFVIEAIDRDNLRKYLKKNLIETLIHYPYPIHSVSAFSKKLRSKEKYPMAEKLAKGIISLPFHQYMTKRQIEYIVKKIKKFYEKT